MLPPEQRFNAPSGLLLPGGPSIWHVIDFDQRRMVSVSMDGEIEDDQVAREHLRKHADNLAPDVVKIHVSPQGDLMSVSTDPDDDDTFCPFYPPLALAQHPDGTQVILRSDLEELDRLGPLVDLVRHFKVPGSNKVVFKYAFVDQHISPIWREMNLCMRLPKHPHIVPFHSIVVDEIEWRLVGFTTLYVPGGTLQDNKTRVFKLKWLHQLTAVVDELNLNFGIAHQDVAPRNLLINEQTDSLMIFDFDYSSRIGAEGHVEVRNDIKGVLFTVYEIITRNETLRMARHEEQNVSDIEEKEWEVHPEVRLDHPVSEFRAALAEWSKRRREGEPITFYKDAPSYIDWPDRPGPPLAEFVYQRTDGAPVTEMKTQWTKRRARMLEDGDKVLEWQRPPQAKLKPEDRMLATGEPMHEN